MEKQIKTLLLVVFLLGTLVPVWGQASTEGKEFWVALNMTTGTGGTDHEPFICITTQHPGGSYTISNPADQSFTPITGLIPPTGYIKIKASTNPGTGEIDLNKWYPVGQTAQAVSNQIKNVGLKVTTTVDCSVFAGNRLPQSFDAANILPITALQTEYITQDYPGYDHENKGGGYPVTTILATENNTTVRVIPSSAVLNSNGTATIVKTLDAGQVLYITGDNRASLSGTMVNSDKKIAVFTGVNNTDVPGPVSARDHLYEQNMPVDYWGTHFVVTRSMKKDANRIRVTASNNGTELIVDGISLTTINAGETYEFELCEAVMRTQDGYTKAVGEGRGTEFYLDGEAHYLETTCPCAVYSYDVSEKYFVEKNGTSERDPNSAGDPAMVWISPLEQQLRKVTFGVMNTDQTPTHYVNIITPTTGAASLEVKEIAMKAGQVVYGNNLVQPSDVKPVPSNPAYSYARIKLTEDAESVYTITSDVGFIAHVYGSGTKESYAYSCGSAAVKQGIYIGGIAFTDGYIYDQKFCFGNTLSFDANVGTDEISSVDWDFGDGTTIKSGPVKTEHTYTSPGWYDVTAVLYGHQVCTNEADVELGSVSCSFLVYRPDTLVGEVVLDTCISVESYKMNPAYYDDLIANGKIDTVQENCYDDVVLNMVKYRRETEEIKDTLEGKDIVYGYNGNPYTRSTDVVDESINEYGCSHYTRYYVHVIQCMDLAISGDGQSICPGDSIMTLYYSKSKGEILNEEGRFVVPGLIDEKVTIANGVNDQVSNGKIELPTQKLKTPGHYTGKLIVEDANCDTKEFTLHFTVNYPSDIFLFKFNNVLAVYQNKGYDFTAYQWYRNGEPVKGATSSILYLGEGISFNEGDIVYVVLTDKSGMVLPSCAQIIEKLPPLEDNTNNAPAQKVLINNKFRIIKGDMTFDIYGQRVQ